MSGKAFGERLRKRARALARRLRRDHGGIGRHIPMRRVTRRRDLDARELLVRKLGQKRTERFHDMISHDGKQILAHGAYQP
jgi:hypothetical protein